MIVTGLTMHVACAASKPIKKALASPHQAFTWTRLYIAFNADYCWTARAPIYITRYNLYDDSTKFCSAF